MDGTHGINSKNLSSVLGRNSAHVVVDSRQDRDRLLGDVDSGEDGGGLRDSGETLVENLWREVRKLEEAVVLVGTDSTTLADLDRHRARDDVARGEVLGLWE